MNAYTRSMRLAGWVVVVMVPVVVMVGNWVSVVAFGACPADVVCVGVR